MFREALVLLISVSSGLLISLGVTSVLLVISLVPRLAGKTGTANHIFMYENILVMGLLFGNLWNLFGDVCKKRFGFTTVLPGVWGLAFCLLYGLVTGIFVGCIAMALAEMLDAIPIFARRANLKREISVAVTALAIGKTVGSMIMFHNGWSA